MIKASGRTKISYNYSGLGSERFLKREEFQKKTKMKQGTFYQRVTHGELKTVRNGQRVLVLNPNVDLMAAFNALPALLTYEEVCEFFCEEDLAKPVIDRIGFFNCEDGLCTDKRSLADYLEEVWCD